MYLEEHGLDNSRYPISKHKFSVTEDLRAWEAVNKRLLHELCP